MPIERERTGKVPEDETSLTMGCALCRRASPSPQVTGFAVASSIRALYLCPMEIFTIGYEGATQALLIATLQVAGVELVADVRAVPLSRRPGFSKNILAAGLREAGIDYIGLKALGTPAEGREAARKGNHQRLAEVYAGQLELPEAIFQGAQLLDMAARRATALLCFERDPQGCHRSLLVDAIMPGATVINLFV